MESAAAKQRLSISRQVSGGAASENSGVVRQLESVRRQSAGLRPDARAPGSGFFTIPWDLPVPEDVPVVASTCQPAIPSRQLAEQVDAAARKEGLDPALVREVVRQESAFDPCAVSPMGAQGLMQLMPATQAQYHVGDAFDVVQNLTAGTQLLRELLGRYNGDLASALAAYNAGPKRVDEAGGIPPIQETRKYVSDILSRLPR